MIPSQMIVVKRIKAGRKVVADVGTVLKVVTDYNRIGGIDVLQKKSGKYICDYGSILEKDHCKPYHQLNKK